MDLLRRIRWGNVARAAALAAALVLVVAWPRLRSEPPSLPPEPALAQDPPAEFAIERPTPGPRRERRERRERPKRRSRRPSRRVERPAPVVRRAPAVPRPAPPAPSAPVWRAPAPRPRGEFSFE